ncbi:MAG: UvrD-helicase domain-containing protein [Acidobacteriota bacterium]|nr:UvrD-helicase domain-containing protein [Acidobacteriota bacterium]
MKSLKYVKNKAREFRLIIAEESTDPFEGIKKYLLKKYGIVIRAVPSYEIDYSEGELSVGERTLYYDEELDKNPVQRLLVIAHEAGHLIIHKRLTDKVARIDPLSPYLNTGAPALARYNSRSREEVEADAFANEFVCPSEELFSEWRADRSASTKSLAEKYNFPEDFIKNRLAEGLYEIAIVHTPETEKEENPKEDDPTQIEVARHIGTPTLVNAGPGTGKTSTLIMKMKHLLGVEGAKPYEMLVLTFSTEAAEELRSRIEEEFGAAIAGEVEITTFHGFGHAFLLAHGFNLEEDYPILDEARQEELVLELLGKVECDSFFDLKSPEETAHNCVRQICLLKERRISPEILEAEIEKWKKDDESKTIEQKEADEFLALFRAYEEAKEKLSTVDFADLINIPLDLLENNPVLVAGMRAKYKWVMVDEYQDVSRSVASLLKNICGDANPPWVVGDLRQAIYLFCGASRENISNFSKDFKNPKIFELETNYRSCDEIIEVANQLADIMECSNKETNEFLKRWKRGTKITSFGNKDSVIKVAQADSDQAEYEGIARQVNSWIEQGAKPQDIAVLARRNIDVRNISLALGKRGIKATTTGLITPEGAAGDLAAVSTFIDGRRASLPRIVYALGRDRFEKSDLNRAVENLSQINDNQNIAQENEKVKELMVEVARLDDCLGNLKHTGDAFSVICAFLFDGSDYLRHVLDVDDEAKRSLILSEIITSLSWAVGYRFSHAKTPPKDSRIGFGQYFRNNLSSAKPGLVAPRPVMDAVQVMTCHASKGLEFPCVVLAGQTLSLAKNSNWLPPALEPAKEDDIAQADALFFVGVTRAQRALLVSYAKTPRRTITPLLEKWIQLHSIQVENWEAEKASGITVTISPIWGGSQPKNKIAAPNLSKGKCGILIYLDDFYEAKFPTIIKPLYPRFFVAARTSMGKIIRQAQKLNRKLTSDEAEAIFKASFSDEEVLSHPHYKTYSRRGNKYVVGLAKDYSPEPRAVEFIDMEDVIGNKKEEELLPLRLDLIAHFRDDRGASHAILFRPEALGKPKNGELPKEITWSSIKENPTSKKLPFVLLRKVDPEIQPWVFSGEDGKVYKLKWNKITENMDEDADSAASQLRAFSSGNFEATINDFFCDNKCRNRIPCPHWMNAIM